VSATKKKAGRPKADPNQERSPGVSIRLNVSEMKEIRAAIKESGLSQSDWARKYLLAAARDDKRNT
jgi:hypothetical protein